MIMIPDMKGFSVKRAVEDFLFFPFKAEKGVLGGERE